MDSQALTSSGPRGAQPSALPQALLPHDPFTQTPALPLPTYTPGTARISPLPPNSVPPLPAPTPPLPHHFPLCPATSLECAPSPLLPRASCMLWNS